MEYTINDTHKSDLDVSLGYSFNERIKQQTQKNQKLHLIGHEKKFCLHSTINQIKTLIKYKDNIIVNIFDMLCYILTTRKYNAFFLVVNMATSLELNNIYKYNNILSKTINTTNLLSLSVVQGFLGGAKKLISLGASPYQTIINNKNEECNLIMSVVNNHNYYFESTKRKKNIIKTLNYLCTILPVNYQNNQNQTALMLACRSCNYDFVKELILFGADPNIRDMYGNTACYYLTKGIPNFGVLNSKKDIILQLLEINSF